MSRPVLVAREILDVLPPRMEAAGVVVPARRFLWWGEPVIDCDLFVVAIDLIFDGSPGQEIRGGQAAPCVRPHAMAVTIHYAVCPPRLDAHGRPPSAADQDTAAETVVTAAYTCRREFASAWQEGDLFDPHTLVAPGRLRPLPEEGDQIGFEFAAEIQL